MNSLNLNSLILFDFQTFPTISAHCVKNRNPKKRFILSGSSSSETAQRYKLALSESGQRRTKVFIKVELCLALAIQVPRFLRRKELRSEKVQ